MEEFNEKELKLIYVLKIGRNTKGEGIYEFIFSKDETNIDVTDWRWDLEPACDNAEPPESDYIDAVINLKAKDFTLICLHEAVDRPYMHGYHNIHALAYEDENGEEEDEDGFDQYEEIFDEPDEEPPLLVFHYGMSLGKVKELLYERKYILKGEEFVHSSIAKFE